MNTSENGTPSSSGIENAVLRLGRTIFEEIGRQQPSTFDTQYWSGKIMQWAMSRPDFKVNLLRFVDVLPSLTSSAEVMSHVNEYLGPSAKEISGLLAWGISVNPHSLQAKVAAMVVRRSGAQMASQLIAGSSAKNALKSLKRIREQGLAFTVDLLGEFCVSEKEANDYLNRYLEALDTLGKETPSWAAAQPILPGHPGEQSPVCISIKLSALYSQCSVLNIERSVAMLSERLGILVKKAKEVGALLYVDAEDSASNPVIYQTFKYVFGSAEFKDFPYPGIVVQAYSKDSYPLVERLIDFARRRGAPIAIRLVKGAYWDSETTLALQNGWPSPLFSYKESSDANYERITDLLLSHSELVLPAFASHNVRSLAYACCRAEESKIAPAKFELQMLYGMADPIAKAFKAHGYLSRLYVPLGEMLPGMGYLVRRLLENTSNDSFLRHTFFDETSRDDLLKKPIFKEELHS